MNKTTPSTQDPQIALYRARVNQYLNEWTEHNIDIRQIAIDYVALQNDYEHILNLNEIIAWKYEWLIDRLPTYRDVERIRDDYVGRLHKGTFAGGDDSKLREHIKRLNTLLQILDKLQEQETGDRKMQEGAK